MAETIELKFPVWDDDGKCYRPGKAVEVPEALAARIRAPRGHSEPTTTTINIGTATAPAGGDAGASTGGSTAGSTEAGGGGQGGTAPTDPPGTDLPAGFPGREYLIAGEILTVAAAQAKSKDDLIALPGIGDATAQKILDWKPAEAK